MARPSSRDRILDAFEATLIDHGAAEATLEAIADAAGVSKGGLLYHFASKDELFAAFGERLLARIDEVVAAAPTEPADVVRWYLDPEPVDTSETELWRSILAALHVTDSGLDDLIAEGFARYARPLGVLDPVLAEQVRLVGDGLFLNSLVGIAPRPALDTIVDEFAARASGRRTGDGTGSDVPTRNAEGA